MDNAATPKQLSPLPRRRGRPNLNEGPALDRQLLVDKLIVLAQEKGIEALNMRSVAASLGVSTKLLYYYVRDKDEMVGLLSDAILARNPPDLSSPDWQTRLRTIARTNYDNFRQFPGLPAAMLARILRKTSLPQANALRKAIFQALEDAGLERAAAEEAFLLYSVVAVGGLTMLGVWVDGDDLEIGRSAVERSLFMGIDLVIFGITRLANGETGALPAFPG